MIWQHLYALLIQLYNPIDSAENHFLKMKNISMISNQIIFLMLADRIFISEPKITCLYTLMFYNVVTYCIFYIKELIEKEDWSPYVTLTERSKIKHLAMSATKIVFEWTKAVTFIVTLTFMLLVFGLEQDLEHYKLKDLLRIYGPALKLEYEILKRYRRATLEEIKQFDDVCAVCLCDMTRARITPCYHLFHAGCLRQCLKTNDTCP
ncbi:hypothetical protein WN48_11346, partial [Eufriesea mexicana]